MTDLGTLGGTQSVAYGINDSGTIVGLGFTPTAFHAFSYSNRTIADLGALGELNSAALSINSSGVIVGYLITNGGIEQAFSYNNGTMTSLGALGGSGATIARAINSSGTIVGAITFTGPYTGAFSDSNGTVTDLGLISGSLGPGLASNAFGINNSGFIVGYSAAGNVANRPFAFSYSNGTMISLGTLPGGTYSSAYAINSSGTIVGYGNTGSSSADAFVYSNGQISRSQLVGQSARRFGRHPLVCNCNQRCGPDRCGGI